MAGLTARRARTPRVASTPWSGGPADRCRTAGGLALVLLATAMLAGACGLSTTPYNARLSCETVGGRYTADGRCQAGAP